GPRDGEDAPGLPQRQGAGRGPAGLHAAAVRLPPRPGGEAGEEPRRGVPAGGDGPHPARQVRLSRRPPKAQAGSASTTSRPAWPGGGGEGGGSATGGAGGGGTAASPGAGLSPDGAGAGGGGSAGAGLGGGDAEPPDGAGGAGGAGVSPV